MSVYESISRASLRAKRRLFDYNVSLLGQEMKAIRISFEEDMFHNIKITDVLQDDEIQVVLRFPTEMPLERYRLGSKPDVGETRTYFFEILPIEAYSKLIDKIEKNDFLFFFLEDEQNNKIPYLLQVTDAFGKFEIGMVWKKQYLAPYYGHMLDQIVQYLEDYVISKKFDEFKEENPDSEYLLTIEKQKEYIHEAYKNLFINPLNPRNQEVIITETTVIQTAFGSIQVLGEGQLVTPEAPLRIELEEGESSRVIYLVVSEDCQFPSVYASENFHPFTLNKKDAFALEELFHSSLQGNFKLNFAFLKNSGISPIVIIDEDEIFLQDDFFIFGDYDYQKFRPLFYVEDTTGKFIAVRLKQNYELEFSAKTNETEIFEILGDVESLSDMQFEFNVQDDIIVFNILGRSITIEGVNIFYGRNFYIGYEPERYLNDFIRQVYG